MNISSSFWKAKTLRAKLALCFFGLVGAVGLTVFLATSASHHAANKRLSEKVATNVTSTVAGATADYTHAAQNAAGAVAAAISINPNWINEPATLSSFLRSYTGHTHLARYVFVGLESGNFVGVERVESSDNQMYSRQRIAPTDTFLISRQIDDKGQFVSPPTSSSSPYDPRARPWYARAKLQAGPIWTAPYLSASKGIMVTTYAQPIYGANGSFIGVIGIDFTLSHLQRTLNELRPTPDTHAFVFTAEGELVASTAQKSADPALIPTMKEAARDGIDASGAKPNLLRANGAFTTVRQINGTIPLRVVVQVPEADLMGSLIDNFGWALLGSILVVGIATLIGRGILNGVSTDLDSLARSAREVVQGAAITALPTSRQDEIGDLARTFHAMRSRVLRDLTSARSLQQWSNLRFEADSPTTVAAWSRPSATRSTAEMILVTSAVEAVRDPFAIIGFDQTILYANPGFAKLLGEDRGELTGQPFSRWLHHRQSNVSLGSLVSHAFESSHTIRKTLVYVDSSGKEGVIDIAFSPVPSSSGVRSLAVSGRDVTTAVANSDALYRAAKKDPQTGIWRREAFSDALAARITEADCAPFALLFVDLDAFKTVNDAHGHAIGDRVLRRIGVTLRAMTREEDLVCRFGGDEFAIALRDRGSTQRSLSRIDSLIRGIEEIGRTEIGPHSMLSASVGIARFPEHGEALETLFVRADEAMYEAKRAGGRQAVEWSAKVVQLKPSLTIRSRFQS